MLTAKNCKAGGAVEYFTNYYDQDETRWFGEGAKKLGLIGSIEKESFENICHGKSPDGSQYLGYQGDPEKRRAGTDFTFSAPKSVSLTALVGGDNRLEVAHRIAVGKTLAIMQERYAQTRITKDKQVSEIKTGNLVVAQFDHIESRELDPHLHTHALVMNLTEKDDRWYANDNDRMFQHKKHLGMIYQSYLAAEVRKLGYDIEHRPHGQFEIKGYDRENLVAFSKRRMQILTECPGNSSWQTREDSWDRTRKNKEHLPSTELKARWQKEAADLGIEIVRPGAPKVAIFNNQKTINDAIEHCSERSADFKIEDLEKFVLAQRLPIDISEIKTLCDERAELIKLDDSYTTVAALVREKRTISLMEHGQNESTPIAPQEQINDRMNNSTLNAGQRQAVRLAASSTDRVIAWQGVAGAGKTFALAELKAIADISGVKIQGFAPSAEAAKTLSDELGIEAQTVARKICTSPEPVNDKVLWMVDEAGLLSADDALALLSRAEQENAKILLVGDTRQLSSVGAGNPFKSLQAAGMATALLSESLRQKDPNLKAAVDALADGSIERGFDLLEKNNSIITTAKDEIAQQIADEYLALSPAQRSKALIVSGTNEKRREITAAIREGLKAEGSIGHDEVAARQFVDYRFTKVEDRYAHNYSVGDTVIPIRNYRQLARGQSYQVERKIGDELLLRSPEGGQISTDLEFDKAHYREEAIGVAVGDQLRWKKNDKDLNRRNGQEFEVESINGNLAEIKYHGGRREVIDLSETHHFESALATTIYSSQGKTSDTVFVAADGMQSSESVYVAASRAKYDLKIYTDSPERLRSMAVESRSNTNPQELISKFHQRQAALLSIVKNPPIIYRVPIHEEVEPNHGIDPSGEKAQPRPGRGR